MLKRRPKGFTFAKYLFLYFKLKLQSIIPKKPFFGKIKKQSKTGQHQKALICDIWICEYLNMRYVNIWICDMWISEIHFWRGYWTLCCVPTMEIYGPNLLLRVSNFLRSEILRLLTNCKTTRIQSCSC